MNFIALVQPYLEILAYEFKTTAFLVVEDKGEIVYLDKFEPSTTMRATLPLGSRQSIHSTSLGKALLACYPIDKVKQLIGDESALVPKTKRTITSYGQLIKELKITKQRGYAIDNRENNDNVYCLGVPILNDKNQPIAAISLSFLYYEVKNYNIKIVANKLRNVALEISRKLGYKGDTLY